MWRTTPSVRRFLGNEPAGRARQLPEYADLVKHLEASHRSCSGGHASQGDEQREPVRALGDPYRKSGLGACIGRQVALAQPHAHLLEKLVRGRAAGEHPHEVVRHLSDGPGHVEQH